MEGFKGTPGLWVAQKNERSLYWGVFGQNGITQIAEVYNHGETGANARLIAAALELGRVSQDALRLIELIAVAAGPNGLSLKLEGRTFEINFDKIRSDLEAAIDKALGS